MGDRVPKSAIMKNLLTVFIATILLTNCSPYRRLGIPEPCNENLIFKKEFFYNIWVIQKYTIEGSRYFVYENRISTKQFLDSYNYLFDQTGIKPGDVFNYDTSYEDYKSFEIDKKKWLKWYDNNRCNYLVEKSGRVSSQ